MSKILAVTAMLLVIFTSSITPSTMSLTILAISTIVALSMFKATMSSWLTFVVILTFSSGMMTLFIYVSSLSSNEKSKSPSKIPAVMATLLLVYMTPTNATSSSMKVSMKSFSSQTTFMVMATTLIITMLAVSLNSYNPNQIMTSNF